MSYCIAWKKDNHVFMVAESAISTITDNIESDISTFGEVQGLYGQYYVQEGKLKILRVHENFIVGFAGDASIAEEFCEQLHNMGNLLNLQIIKEVLLCNYVGLEVSAIIIETGSSPKLYLFDGEAFTAVDECEIGIAKENPLFTQDVKSILNHFYQPNIDYHDYLALIIGELQCYSLRNNCIREGYGGTFYGVSVGTKISWLRDCAYYIFDKDIQQGDFISVISRQNSVFTTSATSDRTLFLLNQIKDLDIWNDLYARRSIIKSVHTKNPYYLFLYSKHYNVLFYIKANCESQQLFYKRWIKRNSNSVYCAFAFPPELIDLCLEYSSTAERIPALIELPSIPVPYISHESALLSCDIHSEKVVSENLHMDFDFSAHEYNNYDSSAVRIIKNRIRNFHNLVLIDYRYFYNTFKDVYNRYNGIREMNIEQIDLATIVSLFTVQIADKNFKNYLLVFVKPVAMDSSIEEYSLENIISQNSNCVFIEVNDFSGDFCGTLYQLMKNYYLNDDFFHLDKFVLIADNPKVNDLLLVIAPQVNYCDPHPDILLVRNLNGETEMDGCLRYAVMENWVAALFGISLDEMGELDAWLENNEC